MTKHIKNRPEIIQEYEDEEVSHVFHWDPGRPVTQHGENGKQAECRPHWQFDIFEYKGEQEDHKVEDDKRKDVVGLAVIRIVHENNDQ